MTNKPIEPGDYLEPRCVLCEEPYGVTAEVKAVPQRRIIEKMNDYMSRRDYAGAERHLLYWLEEAGLGRDLRGELVLRNELIGHYRKTGEKEKALEHVEKALSLLERLAFEDTISAGTTYVNAGTALNAFSENERAMELFEKARAVYESITGTDPSLLGGLYNNMALTCTALQRYDDAYELYGKAMEVMGRVPNGELAQAITCLNMADLLAARDGMEAAERQICDLLDRAYDLLRESGAPRDGYYAFVCEKCAPAFSYYGYFLAAEDLQKTSEQIYAAEKE